MIQNQYNGLIMYIDFEEREWTGGYLFNCAHCQIEFYYDVKDDPIIVLSYIENAYLDRDIAFCTYNCMEDWLNEFMVKSIV